MKKVRWKRAGILIACICAVAFFGMQIVLADVIDMDRAVTLTLNCICEDEPVPDIEFVIYRVASFDEEGSLSIVPGFDEYAITWLGTSTYGIQDVAETLDGYSQRDNLPIAVSGVTDENGILKIPAVAAISPGVYLCEARQLIKENATYTIEPFFVTLPYENEENEQEYHAEVYPKILREEERETVERSVVKIWKDEETLAGTTGNTAASDTDAEGTEDSKADNAGGTAENAAEDGTEADAAADTKTEGRPKQIEAQLLRNGKVYETVTLSAENNWRYTWPELDAEQEWLVVEKDVPENYTVITDLQDTTFVITNTKEETPTLTPGPTVTPVPSGTLTPTVTPEASGTPTPTVTPGASGTPTPIPTTDVPSGGTPTSSGKLPQTGLLWWPIPFLAIAGLALFIVGWLRHRKDL
jgi:hypothetical protein